MGRREMRILHGQIRHQAARRACRKKHRHPSQGKAEAHLRSLIRLGKAEEDELQTYLCPHCSFWHVGHTPGRKTRRSA